MNVTERFLRYVAFDTMSDEFSVTCPSTAKQKKLGAFLVEDMKGIGLADAHMDEKGYVYATLPATSGKALPVLGLVAHMDTSPDCSGAEIRTRIVEYAGGDIVLDEATGRVMRESDNASLTRNRGKHLIVTDGSTLLGADDKAGVAEIVTACEELLASGAEHGTIRIGFTPDEEIGRGADEFDVPGFAADYAYTVDGGTLGEIEYENFNAASAEVNITGFSIHPGSAKDKMRNASLIAMEFNAALPQEEIPAKTEGYEGFFHLTDMQGECEKAQLRYIIRDHDREKFEQRKKLLVSVTEAINARWGEGTAELKLRDSYFNMRELIEPHMEIIHRAEAAMRENGIEPQIVPIRGGTDGARLSYEGLPCPNLPTGGENFHGPHEYIPIEDMEKMVAVIKTIITDLAK